MPFTPTHVLGVLPLHFAIRKLPLASLAIGSMIPDFTMFYPIASYGYSHSLIGLVGYCLPMGMVVYYLWEEFGKVLAIDLSPLWIRYRIARYRNTRAKYDFREIGINAIAIVIGSLTHTAWDAFTHQGEWGLKLIPLLERNVEIANIVIPAYKLFQYGSTFIGLPLLAILCFLYLKNIQPCIEGNFDRLKKSWLTAIVVGFAVMLSAIALSNYDRLDSFKNIIGNTIKQSLGAGILLFFLYAIAYRLSNFRNPS